MDAGKLPPRASARIYHEGVPQRDTVSDTLTYTLHQTYVPYTQAEHVHPQIAVALRFTVTLKPVLSSQGRRARLWCRDSLRSSVQS